MCSRVASVLCQIAICSASVFCQLALSACSISQHESMIDWFKHRCNITKCVKVLRAKQSKAKPEKKKMTNHRREMEILKTVPRLRLVQSPGTGALLCFALLVTLDALCHIRCVIWQRNQEQDSQHLFEL